MLQAATLMVATDRIAAGDAQLRATGYVRRAQRLDTSGCQVHVPPNVPVPAWGSRPVYDTWFLGPTGHASSPPPQKKKISGTYSITIP